MIQVDLTNEEKELLSDVLSSTLKNLSYEIADTDAYDYREGLKKRRDALQKLKHAIDTAQSD